MQDNRSVYERLDSIDKKNDDERKMLAQILKELKGNKAVNEDITKLKPNMPDNSQIISDFIRRASKESIWFGPEEEYKKSKVISIFVGILIIFVGILSTVITIAAQKNYSGFSIVENIWTIMAITIFSKSIYVSKRMPNELYKDHACTIFVQDNDGIWIDTLKEKKRYSIFRRLSYLCVIGNIVLIWANGGNSFAVGATILEILFLGLSVGLYFATTNLYSMYGIYVIATGRNMTNTRDVTLLLDMNQKKIRPMEDVDEKLAQYL